MSLKEQLEYFYSNTLYFLGISGTWSTFTRILCTLLVFLVLGVLLLGYFVLFRYFWYLEYFYSNTLYFIGISGTWSTFSQIICTFEVFLVFYFNTFFLLPFQVLLKYLLLFTNFVSSFR